MSDTQPLVEALDGGLVSSKDPAHLRPGELTLANDAVYHPNDSSIHKVKGRTTYNTIAIGGPSTVKGLRYLAFDDDDNLLVAHADDDLFYSVMNSAETGSFSSLEANVGSGETLDSVQYNNKHYLFFGAGTRNKVVLSDKTTSNHGMFPIPDPPTIGTTSGAWNTALGIGYYFFITTEIFRPGTVDEKESTSTLPAEKIPFFQFTSSNITTTSLSITKPITQNSDATDWRVYMAGPFISNGPIPVLVEFKLVGQQAIGSSVMYVGNTSTGNVALPTANSIAAGGGWTTPNNAHTNDNVGATATTTGQATTWHTFGYTGLTGTITGIFVRIKLKWTVNTTIWTAFASKGVVDISLTSDNLNFTSVKQEIKVGSTGGFVSTVHGGSQDLWGRAWVLTDINSNSNFGVKVNVTSISTSANSPQFELDMVEMHVYTNSGLTTGNQIGGGAFFPTISISVGGITSIIGSRGLPPIATTADIFEDQLVTNDTRDKSIIRYSLPGYPEYFPSLYFVNFETKETDNVTCVRKLGDKLLVGMKNMVFRVNYLPRESDAEFDRGRCYESLLEHHGIVGHQAATTLTVPGGPVLLAFISYSGVHLTDGFQAQTLSDEIDWPTLVDIPSAADTTDYLQNAILVDYPLNYWLVMFYTPSGATTNTRALIFHYHPTHRKENGKMKITGPIVVRADSATIGQLSNLPLLLTGRNDGKVYVEDRAYTDASGGTINFAVRTREIYPGGPGRAVTLNTMFVRHRDDVGSTVTVTPRTRFLAEAQASITVKTFATTNGGAAELPFSLSAESLDFKLSEEAPLGSAGIRISHLSLELAGTGLTERRT